MATPLGARAGARARAPTPAPRVLVTGATGFTGQHLARTLAARGHRVRALVRDRERGRALTELGVELLQGDLRDRQALARAVDGVEIVYHVAALFRKAGVTRNDYRTVNAETPRVLGELAAHAGVRRFVHTSTIGVHGHIADPPASEEYRFSPGDPYQETKLDGELAIKEVGERTGMEVTVVRPAMIYGPGDRRFLKLFRAVSRERFPMIGDGHVMTHLVHVADLVEGFLLCAQTPAAAGRTYIIGGPDPMPLSRLVRTIAQVAGVSPPRLKLPVWPFRAAGALCEAVCLPLHVEPPLYRRRVAFFTKSRHFDISRARNELGYTPRVGAADGVRSTLAWYRAHGWM